MDSKIEDLLHLLSLYSAEPQCHKILEFLIRRYRVHEFNGDDLLKCMITQHDTKAGNSNFLILISYRSLHVLFN